MTATVEGEIYEMRDGENNKGVKRYVRGFYVTTTAVTDGANTVGAAVGLPLIGDTHPDDSGAWCYEISVKCVKGWRCWNVTASYSSERELAVDPTTEPAIVKVHTEQFQREAEVDINGHGIVNSAGDPFDPPYMMDDSRRVINVQKNMSGHPSWLLSYADVVNSDTFVVKGITYAIGVGKVQRVDIGEEQTRNGVPFVVVTYEIHLRRDGWILRPMDVGFRQLAYDGLTRINIYNPASSGDTNGGDERVSAPVPLNGSGAAIANPTAATSVYGASTVYVTAPFTELPLT